MKKTSGKKLLLLIIAILAAILASIFLFRHSIRDRYEEWQRGPIPTAIPREAFIKPEPPLEPVSAPEPTPEPISEPVKEIQPTPVPPKPTEPPPEPTPPTPSSTLPREINLAVPFVLQAPYAVWDALHDDACEEASAIMMKGFALGEKSYSKEEMESQILAAVEFEEKTFGYSKDTSTKETMRIISEFFGIPGAKILPINSVNDIKEQLAAGRPVMVPAYGRALKNPYFTGAGPLYHMLVIKGYTPGKFITHDPGTKRGADFVYDETLLFNAIHDWNNGDVPNGPRVMVVIE